VDLRLRPGVATVAYSGSRARAVSVVPFAEYEKLQARIAELEEQLEEEALVLAALSAD
jgi:hypothetical protein